MSVFQVAEVVETKMAYKPDQKDESGKTLPLGTIQIRLGGQAALFNQVRNVYAAPAVFNRRIPLIGEHVTILSAPIVDKSNPEWKKIGFVYYSPYNATDEMSIHQFPKLWDREQVANGSNPAAPRLSDREEVGYTYPKTPPRSKFLQPYEGDDIWEGRLGQSIRFTRHSTTVNSPGTGIYQIQPTWEGQANLDPLMILKVNSSNVGSGYSVENLSLDDSSIYLTSKQKLVKFKPGFKKNQDVSRSPNWADGSQVLMSADRAVINAKTDMLMLIGKTEAILTSDLVRFQTQKYNVSLDDLMDYINAIVAELWKLTMAQATFTTFSGPTGPATNVSQVTTLHKTEFNSKFKRP